MIDNCAEVGGIWVGFGGTVRSDAIVLDKIERLDFKSSDRMAKRSKMREGVPRVVRDGVLKELNHRCVWCGAGRTTSPSHRREPSQQRLGQPHSTLPELSPQRSTRRLDRWGAEIGVAAACPVGRPRCTRRASAASRDQDGCAAWRRSSPGHRPTTRLKARANAASDSYPSCSATAAVVWRSSRRAATATCIRQRAT